MNIAELNRKFGHSMINICGSKGEIVVNSLGYPLFPDSADYEYGDIVRFDIGRLSVLCHENKIPLRNEWDILAVGYWTKDGGYEDPAPDYAEHGAMRHIWNGTCEGYEDACKHQESLVK